MAGTILKVVLRPGTAKSGWGRVRWSAAPTALIIFPQYPSPSGLGSRLADGPPGLDALLGRTFHSSEINRHPAQCGEAEKEILWTSLSSLSRHPTQTIAYM